MEGNSVGTNHRPPKELPVPLGAGADTGVAEQAHVAAMLTHEMRTPLATLRTTLDVLADAVDADPETAIQLVQRLRRNVVWLVDLVENVSSWTSIVADRLDSRRDAVALLDCVDRAADLVQPLLQQKDQRLSLVSPQPSPIVYGNQRQLAQVLTNLLSNASAYSQRGDTIDLTVSTTGGTVEVRVTDHGPGVSASDQQRIFDCGFRGEAAAHQPAGLGVGLYIVRVLTERHGGTVGVESVPGCGATFWLRFPRAL